ncbi:hypothetical protein [Oligoflexus tunisiensis]|uniref:hypothetical protein n=1 Tax=Oligoflexus tunisiensis TaxID=708132 RepID=UPI00114D1383|nr:hypothetical protein [Oligoflexus tunisiensis]
MTINTILVSVAAFMSLQAVASPIAGLWQGPCETRGTRSVKFTYDISEMDENKQGTIAKTKIYYDDEACSVYNHTGRASVAYTLGEPSAEGIYPLDVKSRTTVFYDIVTISEDGLTLTFGDAYTDSAETRPTTLSSDDRIFVRITE